MRVLTCKQLALVVLFTLHGNGTGEVQETGLGPMGPNVLYGNVHTGRRQRKELGHIVPVSFLLAVLVPFPCSVNKP